MKTEPTKALRELQRYDNMNTGCLHVDVDISPIVITAFKEGQSNPKIKQLEWREYLFMGTGASTLFMGTGASTPFRSYGISCIEVRGDKYFELDGARDEWRFNSLLEAKAHAQADFEARIKECLITE